MITADRAHAYMHWYNQAVERAKPHDPIRAEVYTICAIMCLFARHAAKVSEASALSLVSVREEPHPYNLHRKESR